MRKHFYLFALVLPSVLFVQTPKALANAPCKVYYVASREKPVDLSSSGVTNGLVVGGGSLFAGEGISESFFLSRTYADVYGKFYNYAVGKFGAGNLDTNLFVLLDMEHPAHPKGWGELLQTNPALCDSIIYAMKMRVDAVRSILPNAYLGLYGIFVLNNMGTLGKQLGGFERAKKMGLFDSLDFVSPIFYDRTNPWDNKYYNYQKGVDAVMHCFEDSLKLGKDIVPLLSLMNGNPDTTDPYQGKFIPAFAAKEKLDTILSYPIINRTVCYWNGGRYNEFGPDSLQYHAFRDSIADYFSDSLDLSLAAKYGYSQNGNSISFRDSSANATSRRWSFGDGTHSSAKNPVHQYAVLPHDSTYVVTLTIANEYGCEYEKIDSVKILAPLSGIENEKGKGRFTSYLSGDNLTLNFSAENNESIMIQFYDMGGREISKTEHAFNENDNKSINIGALSKGVYLIRIQKENEMYCGKIIL